MRSNEKGLDAIAQQLLGVSISEIAGTIKTMDQ
jgi:hypothetical protein